MSTTEPTRPDLLLPTRVGPSPRHGLGVFATRDLAAGEVIHIAPVILISDVDLQTIDDTPLHGLAYGWDEEGGTCAFALGLGSLFNHEPDPNCEYHRLDADDLDEATGAAFGYDALQYSTRRPVVAGEELTIDYSGGDPAVLWFEVK